MKRAMFAGTFDPVHYGHLDILMASANLFDEVIWALADNYTKVSRYSLGVRYKFMEVVLKNNSELKNVVIRQLPGNASVVNAAVTFNADWLVRSFRLTADFEYELQLALINRKLNQNIQTVYIPPKQEHLHISSTAVRELLRLGMPVTEYLPEYLEAHLK